MSSSAFSILPAGATSYTLKQKSVPFATLIGKGIVGDDAVTVLTGRAPSLTVTVKDTVPLSIARTLSGDVLVTTHGRGPSSIEIVGLDIYDAECSSSNSAVAGTNRIQDFWSANNVHDNPDARLTLCLGTDKKQVYTCVLVGLTTTNVSATATQVGYTGLGAYRLELVGCPASN